MKKKLLAIMGAVVAIALVALVAKKLSSPTIGLDVVEVNWRLLGELDYITGDTSSKELKSLDGHNVKIPGFMVPLEDNQKSVTEFLLVPTPQACIHVPPPPPNQMVYVKVTGSEKVEVPNGPIWVFGKLNLTVKKTMYGDSSFELEGVHVEPYR